MMKNPSVNAVVEVQIWGHDRYDVCQEIGEILNMIDCLENGDVLRFRRGKTDRISDIMVQGDCFRHRDFLTSLLPPENPEGTGPNPILLNVILGDLRM